MMTHAEYPSPDQAFSIRMINRIGRGLRALGITRPRLAVEDLLVQARRNTGLQDYGDMHFVQGLHALVDSVESEARLSQVGRIAFKSALISELEKRLRLIRYRQTDPQVAEQKIVRPLVIVGLPRTGSTILYELLAQDPDHRWPATWEVTDPFPPASEHDYGSDPRIARVEAGLSQLDRLAPEFNAIHKNGATLPQECVAIFASAFASEQWAIQYYCPGYRKWLLRQDMTPAYLWHFHFLQHLQVKFSRPRWLLKTPSHIGHLHALMHRYPDAAIVQTHRDPTEIMGSLSSLACTLRSAYSDSIDPVRIAAEEVRYYAELMNRGIAQRDATPDADRRFFDVKFTDLLSRPIEVIENIYEHFDFDFSGETRVRMQNYLDHRPRDKHGTHSYSLDKFGLDRDREGALFAAYRERYCRNSAGNAALAMRQGHDGT